MPRHGALVGRPRPPDSSLPPTRRTMTAPQLSFKELRRVVIAAAVGNIIEWYDFYIFGSLAILLASKFFGQSQSGSNLIKYVGTFTPGLFLPPFYLSLSLPPPP